MANNFRDNDGKGKDAIDASTSSSSSSESSGFLDLNGTGQKGHDTRVTQLKSETLQALFVNDIAQDVTEEDLVVLFSRYPGFVSAKVCLDSITNKSLCHGYLNFSNKEDASRAIKELNYMPLKGKEIRIMPSMRKIDFKRNIGKNVFFLNLPAEHGYFTTRFFSDSFEHCGDILSCRLYKDKKIGFIHFMKEEDAQRCVAEYNNRLWLGNRIYCRIHVPEAKGSGIANMDVKNTQGSLQETPEKGVSTLRVTENSVSTGHMKGLTTHRDHHHQGGREREKKDIATIAPKNTMTDIHSAAKDGKERGWTAAGEEEKHTETGPSGTCKTVLLSNLSILCNERFLKELCRQQGVFVSQMRLLPYNKKTISQSCIIECKTRKHAQVLFNYLDNRFIGGSTVKASWEYPKKKKKKRNRGEPPKLYHYVSIPANGHFNHGDFNVQNGPQLLLGAFNNFTGNGRGYT